MAQGWYRGRIWNDEPTVTRAPVVGSIVLALGAASLSSCSSRPECSSVATDVVEQAGWPAAAARWARSAPAGDVWVFGVPAETTSIRPEVAVYVSDIDPAIGGTATLVPVEESAVGYSGPLDSGDAAEELLGLVGDADAIARARECVYRGVAGTSQ
jgi:hypothetical protein